jgi:hypothetical protein
MTSFQPLSSFSKFLAINSVLLITAGCTTLVAKTSIDPYQSNYQKRMSLEQLASKYCQVKQSSSGQKQSAVLPDYRFTTDGCSRWPDKSWLSCCVVHDIMYWCGGSDKDRKEADKIMMQCVNRKTSMLGGVMYPGVRLGGSPWLPTPWRWGYGWKEWPKGYQHIEHQQDINSILKKLEITEAVEKQLN